MEIWKDISSYEGRYQVSSLGRVRSLFRKSIKRNVPLILKPRYTVYGYTRVALGKNNDHYIHRLVAQEFISNEKKRPFVNHINGVKDDNRLSNLEWCTQSENLAHAVSSGLMSEQKGEGNHASKLTSNEVLKIRELCSNGQRTLCSVANQFNVSRRLVAKIVNRQMWTHI